MTLDKATRRAYSGKRVLVTGGYGFIGSTLARALVTLGAKVTVVDSLIPEYGGNRRNLSGVASRSEERRVGKECSEPCRSRWSPYH